MPYFNTQDGKVVHFESRRDPIEPMANKFGAWLAVKWIPVGILLVNLVLISSSKWGVAITLIALFVLVKVGYRAARAAVAEAADWSAHLGKIDRYRAQGARYQRPPLELER